jgi:hypothetical protein
MSRSMHLPCDNKTPCDEVGNDVYGVIVVVDAKDDAAVAFYKRFGFAMQREEARQLVWPIRRKPSK